MRGQGHDSTSRSRATAFWDIRLRDWGSWLGEVATARALGTTAFLVMLPSLAELLAWRLEEAREEEAMLCMFDRGMAAIGLRCSHVSIGLCSCPASSEHSQLGDLIPETWPTAYTGNSFPAQRTCSENTMGAVGDANFALRGGMHELRFVLMNDTD